MTQIASDARRAARNVSVLIIASFISKGVLFAWQIILSSWLGPFDYGVYSTIIGLLAIAAPVASLGMGLIVIRDVARHPHKTGTYWSAALTIQTILALLAYGGGILAAILAGYSDMLIAYTAIAGISLLIDMPGSLCNDLLLAKERMVATALVDIAHILLRVGLAGAVLLAGYGLMGVYLATIATGILRSALLWMLHWRTGSRPVFPIDHDIARSLIIDSLPLALSAFLTLAYQHTDKLMTTSIIGERETGYLGPAFIINFGVIEILSTTVLVAVYPIMSRYYGDGDNPMFGFMVEKLSRFMLMVSLPIALMLSIYAPQIIALIFPPAYAPTAGILSILIWYTAITMVGNVFSKALLIQNRQRLLLLIRMAGLALNIALNTFLLLRYRDPRGAAMASVVAEILIITLLMWQFSATGYHLRPVLGGMVRVIMAAAFAGTAMFLLRDVPFIIGILAGLPLYAGAILFGGALKPDDYDLIYRLLAAMPGGTLIRRIWQRDIPITWQE